MNKVNRTQLKELIKQCILEVLSEGIDTSAKNLSESRHTLSISRPQNRTPIVNRQTQQQNRKFDPALDTPIPRLNSAVKSAAGGDRVLESILKDTAMTTLQEQIAAGDESATGASTHRTQPVEQFKGDPMEVFGDVSDRWAALAFDSPVKRAGSV